MAGWFEVREFDDGVVGIGEPGHEEDVKSYLVRGRDVTLLFDTGTGIGDLRAEIDRLTSGPALVVNSHNHWDHIGNDHQFERRWIHRLGGPGLAAGVPRERVLRFAAPERFSAPPPADFDLDTFTIPGVMAERLLDEGDVVDLGDRRFTVVHTPGHSPDGITLVDEGSGVALVGDAVYAGTLYGHLPGSDPTAYRRTLRRLAELAGSLTAVYPSHDSYPLPPRFLRDVHAGYEEVWVGREPDAVAGGVVRHQFAGFAVLLAEGWRG